VSITVLTPTLGPITPRLVFATLDEARSALRVVIGRAQHQLTIVSPDLEPALYGHPAVISALTQFVLGPGFRRVRILRTGPQSEPEPHHALLILARRLSTSFDVRSLPTPLSAPVASYLVADREATVLRLDAGQWNGMYAIENPAAARTHLTHFDCLWQTCPAPDDGLIAL
jgi:hypothetical protein